ncbi:recA/RAD51 family protein [Coprinopsis sp. MPI-PUGE-AT-0042]|nr:recA/RAD51 family protein [Coprinopsis sp. MPI-PUGE-AT-0042]
MAIRTADSVIDQIQEESLLHLLSSVASEGPKLSTGISGLDEYCHTAGLDYRGLVLELQGPPASGKSHLIYWLLSTCIMPHTRGGWEKAAFIFDLDNTFNILRLRSLLTRRLAGLSAALVNSCLARLGILRPSSSLHLATSLMNTQRYMASQFPNDELGLVAIDSLSAFYWQDRFLGERNPGTKPTGPATVHPLSHVTSALQDLRLSLAPMIALSNWGLVPYDRRMEPMVFRQHLSPFPDLFGDGLPSQRRGFTVDIHMTTRRNVGGGFIAHIRSPGGDRVLPVEYE